MYREVMEALQRTLAHFGIFDDADTDVYFVDENNDPCSPKEADHLVIEVVTDFEAVKRFELYMYPLEG